MSKPKKGIDTDALADAIEDAGGIPIVARMTSKTERSVYRWQNGKRKPSYGDLGLIADESDRLVDDLLE